MINPILSILIPITPDRHESVIPLLDIIGFGKQLLPFITNDLYFYKEYSKDGNIELLLANDTKVIPIGYKREMLYERATGVYSWQIDSDDLISDDAIELVLGAIKNNPDVDAISFEEYVNIDGKEYKSNHSLEYADWDGDGNKIFSDGFHFHRTPFFKSVIKTEIAKSVPVPHERFGEDHHWAQALKSNLKSEVHIPEQIYHYLHISSDFNERYGIKQ